MSRRRPKPAEPRTPLTDEQIAERYGDLIAAALDAFGTDLDYVTEMMRNASRLQDSTSRIVRGPRRRAERDWTTTPWSAAIDEALANNP